MAKGMMAMAQSRQAAQQKQQTQQSQPVAQHTDSFGNSTNGRTITTVQHVDSTNGAAPGMSASIYRASGTDAHGEITAIYVESRKANVALALAGEGTNLPHLLHWGHTLAHPSSAVNLFAAEHPQRVSGMLDETAWPSILPTQSESWIGSSRFIARRGGVEQFMNFNVESVAVSAITSSTSADEDGDTAARVQNASDDFRDDTLGMSGGVQAVVIASDRDHHVRIWWVLQLSPAGLARQAIAVINGGNDSAPLSVDRVELGYPLPAQATEILSTTGYHLHERRPQRQHLTIGRFEKKSIVGRPDFDNTLFLAAGVPGFGFEHGRVYVTHLGWSGNQVMSAERLPYTQGLLGGGELLYGGEVTLQRNESYTTPWLYGSCGDGLNEVSARFHTFVRACHPNLATKPRPVLLNTWEAVYFNHSYDKLAALADKAAATGVERFVVDDGWFSSRRNDLSGLGDWQVSQQVWPDGPKSLKALADHVHQDGMEFGLWFEPEMINPDSDTARAHPDWILAADTKGRLPMEGRHQQVIDLTNPQAWDYIHSEMDGLVSDLGIDYIKWDHNKLVTEPVSLHSGLPAVHKQVAAVYRLIARLKADHPGLEIESCSSGGGRIDLGILRYADRVWVSDCVDPVEREINQRYDSVVVPPEMLGEHVGKSPADSTGRATDLSLRAAMAFFGHVGIEWDLMTVPQDQIDALRVWIDEYKRNRDLFEHGLTVHADVADSMDPSGYVDGIVAQDRSRGVFRYTQLTMSRSYPAAPIHLPGLDPRSLYRVTPLAVNRDLTGINTGQSPLLWWEHGAVLDGEALNTYGVRPPQINPAHAVMIVAERLEG
jgi:alpha-galactosidase